MSIVNFMSPERRTQYLADERKHNRESATKNGEDWDEDRTLFKQLLLLKASSYDPRPYQLFSTPAIETAVIADATVYTPGLSWSPGKQLVYANAIWRAGDLFDLYQGQRRGKVCFDNDVAVPTLYQVKEGYRGDSRLQVWMSITPAECLSQRQGIRRATGHVVLGGLGLGWLLRKVAEKRAVQKITVVEKSNELLGWFGTKLCAKVQRETGTPITVVCDDMLNHMGKYEVDARYLVDIWSTFPTEICDLSPAWREAIASVKHFWGWGVTTSTK